MADDQDRRQKRWGSRLAIIVTLAIPIIGLSVGGYEAFVGRKSPTDAIAHTVIFLLVVVFFWSRIRRQW